MGVCCSVQSPSSRHGHSHGHAHEGHDHDEARHITTAAGVVILEVFEDGVPPRFRLRIETGPTLTAQAASVETVRPDAVIWLCGAMMIAEIVGGGSLRMCG